MWQVTWCIGYHDTVPGRFKEVNELRGGAVICVCISRPPVIMLQPLCPCLGNICKFQRQSDVWNGYWALGYIYLPVRLHCARQMKATSWSSLLPLTEISPRKPRTQPLSDIPAFSPFSMAALRRSQRLRKKYSAPIVFHQQVGEPVVPETGERMSVVPDTRTQPDPQSMVKQTDKKLNLAKQRASMFWEHQKYPL